MTRLFTRLLSATLAVWLLCASLALAQNKALTDPEALFNVESLIYHRATCASARRCTENCIVIKLSEAKKRGGRACKVCGGPATLQDETGGRLVTDFATRARVASGGLH